MAHLNQSTLHIFGGYYADTKFPVVNGELHMVLAQESINYDLDIAHIILLQNPKPKLESLIIKGCSFTNRAHIFVRKPLFDARQVKIMSAVKSTNLSPFLVLLLDIKLSPS